MAQRNFGLDLLRCAAIAIVLANHAFLGFFIELADAAWTPTRLFWSVGAIISIEWLFALSGFLIGAMMIRSFEHERTWWKRARSFWLRRWFRTLPNYYLFLGVNIAIAAWSLSALPTGSFSLRHLVFAQNLAWPEAEPLFFNEAWSLALDEWFYLLLPLLVGFAAVAKAKPKLAFLLATAVLIVVPVLLRLTTALPADGVVFDRSIRRVTIMHLDATGWGVLAAILGKWVPTFWHRHVGAKAIAGGLLMALGVLSFQEMVLEGLPVAGQSWRVLTWWPRFPVAFGLSLTGAGTLLALPWIASLRPPAALWRRGVETVSNYTYSIYLSHFPLMYLFSWVVDPGAGAISPRLAWSLVPLWLAATVAASALVYHVFEKPVSDLRERYTRKVDASPFANPATPP